MQQLLQGRLADTPMDIPQVRSNYGSLLNSSEGRNSVVSLTTCDNNPDVDLTTEPCQNLRVSDKIVYVLNKKGQAISILEGWMGQRLIRQLKQRISLY